MLQKLQQEAVALAEAKQRGLQQLKHLTGRQLELHSQLHQARQDAEGSTSKLDRLQRENSKLQVRWKLCTLHLWCVLDNWVTRVIFVETPELARKFTCQARESGGLVDFSGPQLVCDLFSLHSLGYILYSVYSSLLCISALTIVRLKHLL